MNINDKKNTSTNDILEESINSIKAQTKPDEAKFINESLDTPQDIESEAEIFPETNSEQNPCDTEINRSSDEVVEENLDENLASHEIDAPKKEKVIPSQKKKFPPLAILLSMIIPGLGQVYATDWKKGLMWFIGIFGFPLFILLLANILTNKLSGDYWTLIFISVFLIFFISYYFNLVDSQNTAIKANERNGFSKSKISDRFADYGILGKIALLISKILYPIFRLIFKITFIIISIVLKIFVSILEILGTILAIFLPVLIKHSQEGLKKEQERFKERSEKKYYCQYCGRKLSQNDLSEKCAKHPSGICKGPHKIVPL